MDGCSDGQSANAVAVGEHSAQSPRLADTQAGRGRRRATGPPARLGKCAMTAVIAAIARGDRPVLLASLVAGSGLLLALLCAAGTP